MTNNVLEPDNLSFLTEHQKAIKIRHKKALEVELEKSEKSRHFTFDLIHSKWTNSICATNHPEMMLILDITTPMPSLTSEVEHTFSTMNLVSTPLRAHLLNVNLEHCMRIAKYSKVISDADYHSILRNWFKAESTKSKSRKIENCLNLSKT